MSHKPAFMAVDRTFDQSPFFNKLILFGGDFRQVLPVVKKGNRLSIVNASLKYAPFRKVEKWMKSVVFIKLFVALKGFVLLW